WNVAGRMAECEIRFSIRPSAQLHSTSDSRHFTAANGKEANREGQENRRSREPLTGTAPLTACPALSISDTPPANPGTSARFVSSGPSRPRCTSEAVFSWLQDEEKLS